MNMPCEIRQLGVGRLFLAIDVGNTNAVLGMFKGEELAGELRVATSSIETISECGPLFRQLVPQWGSISGVAISSVVPAVNDTLARVSRDFFGIDPFFVRPELDFGIHFQVDDITQVGADRLVNAAAAYQYYGGPLIILDLGTATTCCAVSPGGDFLGGVILPGPGISMDALYESASRLPLVELAPPPGAIGTNTENSLKSGLYYGYVGMVDGLVHRFKKELGDGSRVVATGGYSSIITRESAYVMEIRPHLTLEGLKLLYSRNCT